MYLIFAAALCSVAVSVVLKYCHARGIHTFQMIAWNYVVAVLLCALWFQPNFSHVSITATPWWVILVLGLLLPGLFICLGRALNSAGVVKTEIAQRLSVLVSVLAAYLLFKEQFNALKLLGLGLGFTAILCILKSKSLTTQLKHGQHSAIYLVLVWVGYAVVDILLKYTSSLGLQFALTLNLSFIFALIFSVLGLVVMRTQWQLNAMLMGLLLGAINFVNIALYVMAHRMMSDTPAVVFAMMNILVVLMGGIAGVMVFKEKLTQAMLVALGCAVAAVFCLALGL